jgi:SAM-dependent methyltransferase
MPANDDQIRYWNERAGQDWVALQARMDANLSGISGAVLAFAAAKPGEAVLDIGCGTGATTLALADAVGPAGRVSGVDVSQPMLDLARKRTSGRATIALTLADASAAPFRPEQDLLFSRFGVMFFDHPASAFANLRTALKPGGRLAFVCWRSPAENPWASVPLQAAKPFLPEQPPPDPLAPGPFAFADAGRVRAILAEAGFSAPRIEKYDGPMRMGRDPDEVAAQTLRIGPLARAAAELDAATREKIAAAVKTALARFTMSDG